MCDTNAHHTVHKIFNFPENLKGNFEVGTVYSFPNKIVNLIKINLLKIVTDTTILFLLRNQ